MLENYELLFCTEGGFTDNDSCLIGIMKDEINGVDELFSCLSSTFAFPEYTGDNWNAILDCLRDFEWISEKTIVLVHREMPILSVEDMKIYLKVLVIAITTWQKEKKHEFYVSLPIDKRDEILDILTSIAT